MTHRSRVHWYLPSPKTDNVRPIDRPATEIRRTLLGDGVISRAERLDGGCLVYRPLFPRNHPMAGVRG